MSLIHYGLSAVPLLNLDITIFKFLLLIHIVMVSCYLGLYKGMKIVFLEDEDLNC